MLSLGTLTRGIASLLGYTLPLNKPSEGNLPFDPSKATVADLRRLLHEETVSSAFLVEQYLAQIEEHNMKTSTNIIIITTASKADLIEQARCLDDEIMEGHIRSPMHGIPILIEGDHETQPKNDPSLSSLLESAGIVLIGHVIPSPPKTDAQTPSATASPTTFLPLTLTHSLNSPLTHLATSTGLYSITPPSSSSPSRLPYGAIASTPKDLALIISILETTTPFSLPETLLKSATSTHTCPIKSNLDIGLVIIPARPGCT